MTPPGSTVSLAGLDDAPALLSDPEILTKNLGALTAIAPRVAADVGAARVPAHWRSVAALDEGPTFRVERAGEPAAWLGGTAAPRTRALALVGNTNFAEQNVALPAAGSGAELQVLLDRLARHQAVFWFGAAEEVRAILTLADSSDAIQRRRLLVFTEPSFEEALAGLLTEHPGLLPPATIVNLPDVSLERIESVRRQCDAAARRVLALRAERMSELRTAAAERSDEIRLACAALGGDERGHAAAREAAAAGRRIGIAAEAFVLDSPLVAHPIALAEMFGRVRPTHVLRFDSDARTLPVRPADATVLRFCDSSLALPARGGSDRPLASSPRVRRALLEAGFRDADIGELFWACAPPAAVTGEREPQAIAIVGDLPDASAAGCGIEQATHRALWERLERLLTSRWGTEDVAKPANVLQLAERELGFRLEEPELRTRLVRLIEFVLTPAVVLRRLYAAAAARFDDRLVAVGRGWGTAERRQVFSSVADAVCGGIRPAAALATVLPQGLSADLVSAAAAEWPILLHVPPREKLAHWLGGVLEGGRHVSEFSTERELQRSLDQVAGGEERFAAQARGARAHVSARHTWDERLRSLVSGLSPV